MTYLKHYVKIVTVDDIHVVECTHFDHSKIFTGFYIREEPEEENEERKVGENIIVFAAPNSQILHFGVCDADGNYLHVKIPSTP